MKFVIKGVTGNQQCINWLNENQVKWSLHHIGFEDETFTTIIDVIDSQETLNFKLTFSEYIIQNE